MVHMKLKMKIHQVNELRKIVLVLVCICNSMFLHSQTETVIDIEGNVYKTVNICSQKWMAENLKTTTYNDGTKIGFKADSVSWFDNNKWYQMDSGYYCYGNFDSSTVHTYGQLYNWFAAKSNKLCPQGWHVPTYKDWIILIYTLVDNGSDYNNCWYYIAKSLASTSGWEPSVESGSVGFNQETNNLTGFNALPSYSVQLNLSQNWFQNINRCKEFSFWSSSPVGLPIAIPEQAYHFNGTSDVDVYGASVYDGFPVRCLKNEKNEVDNISASIYAKTKVICNEDSITLKAIVKDGVKPYRYSWNCFESHDSEYTVCPPQSTSYNLIVVDSMQCYATSSIFIKKESTPKVHLPNDTLFCDSVNVAINLQASPYVSYLWQDSSSVLHYTISSPGTYTVSASNDCGLVSDSMRVEMVKTPQFILPTDTLLFEGKKKVLNVGLLGNYHYTWQDNSTNSQYVISSSGIYTVTVSDEYNCSTTKSINVHDDCYLDVPTAFSPNSDGLNDVLYPIGRNVDDLKFCIFDRWGNKIFESHSIKDGWDGTYNGAILESTTVMYYLSAKTNCNGQSIVKKGNISIIR